MNLIFCKDTIADFLGIFSLSVAPNLLYYAYVPIFFVSILFSVYVYKKTQSTESKVIAFITWCFCTWILLDVITWISVDATTTMISWQLAVIPDFLIYLGVFYLVYIYNFKKDLPLYVKIFFAFITLGFFSLVTTSYNYFNFDINSCEPSVGLVSNVVLPAIRIMTLASILLIGVVALYKKNLTKDERKQIIIFNTASLLLVFIYGFSQFFGDFTNSYDINLIGPLGMVLFLAFLTFLIVHYRAFDIKLIGSQALVWALIVLVGSEFFFVENLINQILVGVTLVISSVSGLLIVRSVKREITLREHLEIANRNQESLIHFVSHQLKGFFTKSKMIFSGIVEDDFGIASKELKEAAKEGLLSDDNAVSMIQDILGASNLKKGTTTYNMKEVDFAQVVKKICGNFTKEVEMKGLELKCNVPETPMKILADSTQIDQVVKNLIDNSLKYTPKGSIEVSLNSEKKDGKDKVLLIIKDTGIGLSESDKNKLFTEGGKGDESLKVNVNSTGYGLYIVKKIVENHGGKIWAESDGRGMGSRFCVELGMIK